MKQLWTIEEEERLKELYPDTTTAELCKVFSREAHKIYNKAYSLKLKKSPEYLQKHVFTMDAEIGRKSRFPKGHRPWNYGCKGLQIGGENTQFKPGHVPHNTKHDGYTRISKDGYIEIRTSKGKFEHLHRVLWKKHHGDIPKGHAIIFKDRNPLNVKISNLQCVSRKELMQRNSFLNLPAELRDIVRVKAVLTRVINQKQGGQENE